MSNANKVVYAGVVLIDLTEDTLNEDVIIDGYTGHDAAGNKITGKLKIITVDDALNANSTNPVENKVIVSALSEKAGKSTTLKGYGITDAYTKTEVDNKVTEVVNSAPEALDTLKELATALGNDPNFATTIATQIGKKANTADLAKVATSGNYNDLSNKPSAYSLPTATSSVLGGVKVGSNISVNDGTISVPNGSTSAKGVVQLTNSTSSTSTTTAATPASVKAAYDLANSKQPPGETLLDYGIKNAYTKAEVDDFISIVTSGFNQCVTLNGDQTILGQKTFGATNPNDGTLTLATLDDEYGWLVSGYDETGKNLTSTAMYTEGGLVTIKNSEPAVMGAYLAEGIVLTNDKGSCEIEVAEQGTTLNGHLIRTAADTYSKTEIDSLLESSSGSGADCLKTTGGVLNGTAQINSDTQGTVFVSNQTDKGIVFKLEDGNGAAIKENTIALALLPEYAELYNNDCGVVAMNGGVMVGAQDVAMVFSRGELAPLMMSSDFTNLKRIVLSVNGYEATADGVLEIPAATTAKSGVMSVEDKTKLNSIAENANNYVLPTASTNTLGGVKTTSAVTNTSGLTACPIIGGVPYYKDTNNTYVLSDFGVTATATELNYCDGVTSNIQTQLDNKLPTTGNAASATKATQDGSGNEIAKTYATNAAVNDALKTKADKKAGVYYIEGTGSTAGVWLGSSDEISEYYPGLTIAYKPSIAGASELTLNINNLGAIPVVRNVSTAVTTHYGVNSIVMLTYTVDNGTAYWKLADYDSDTKTRSSNLADKKMFIIGAQAQSTSGQTTYSNSKCYIGTDNCLYSNGSKVALASDVTGKADKATTLEGYGITNAYTKAEVDSLVANSGDNPFVIENGLLCISVEV